MGGQSISNDEMLETIGAMLRDKTAFCESNDWSGHKAKLAVRVEGVSNGYEFYCYEHLPEQYENNIKIIITPPSYSLQS